MALYRDEVARISLAAIRSQFRPAAFRKLKRVRVEVNGHAVVVKIVRQSAAGCHGGTRRWLECPGCRALVNVIGFVSEHGCGCSFCLRWRGRNHVRLRPGK